MTQPRLIENGAVYLVTQRTILRHHLFAPDPQLNDLFRYVLAISAERTGVRVHAAVLMSTHEHLVVTDPEGRLPEFLHYLHRHVALATKALREWDGPVWDHEPTSVVELRTPQAVAEKIAYAIVNPVVAGLVPYARDWPGVTTRPSDLGARIWRVARPTFYFSSDRSSWPAYATLELTMPGAAIALASNDDEFRSIVAYEVRALESAARTRARELKLSFLGADRCAKLSPLRRARTPEPVRDRNPVFAVGRGRRDALLESAARIRAFRAEHRRTFESWRRGRRDVVFPAGTWLMRIRHGARVDAPGAQ